jgi:hypothetical protein
VVVHVGVAVVSAGVETFGPCRVTRVSRPQGVSETQWVQPAVPEEELVPIGLLDDHAIRKSARRAVAASNSQRQGEDEGGAGPTLPPGRIERARRPDARPHSPVQQSEDRPQDVADRVRDSGRLLHVPFSRNATEVPEVDRVASRVDFGAQLLCASRLPRCDKL